MCWIIKNVIFFFRRIIDNVLEFFFSFVWERNKQEIPRLSREHECLRYSAVELARMIKNQELRSQDVVAACRDRILEVNFILNAMVHDRFDEAMREARDLDARIQNNGLDSEDWSKPFLGVPFTTKETQAVKGLSLTYGLWSRSQPRQVAPRDCEAVARLRAAGAIPIAVTNIPELLIWPETRNSVYWTTKNPHHTGRTPGGSSGGEAALMASYATPISLTSDVGGSTRIPAFNCGLFGYHPTADSTNMKGLFNRTGNEGTSIFGFGFISKNVDDLAPLMKVIAGDKAPKLDLDRQIDIKDIKVYYTESFSDIWISPIRGELTDAMKRVVEKLEKGVSSGATPYYHKAFDNSVNLWRYWMYREPEDYYSLYNNGHGKPWIIWELIKKFLGFNRHRLNVIIRLAEQSFWPHPKADWAEPLTRSLQDDLSSKLGDNGVLILPSGPIPAPYHYFAYTGPYNFGYWGIVNVLKYPAVQVPLGKNAKGLPIGIQVVASKNNDAVCLAVAKYLEESFGGAVMAC